jgi:CDP-glycerol glycerophosphotransferase (TagB/SpsB family)
VKIDRRSPLHWLYLVVFGVNVLAALIWRLVRRPTGRRLVVLYGHKLNGNLLAIYQYLSETPQAGVKPVFLTMDPVYHRELKGKGTTSCLAISPACTALLGDAAAVISDHGLHVMSLMLGRSSLKFFDVWHGIPFKGFDADDFRTQHRYDETWVASELMRDLYVQRFGFSAERVHVTGYARTDRLVQQKDDRQALERALNLGGLRVGKFVLFAPTWQQDAERRSVFPFGLNESGFLEAVAQVCRSHDATLLVRKHLNTGTSDTAQREGVVYVPSATYPDTETVLLISDVLICDWSSIAFDYLLLDRPTLFLEVEPPFRKGFSLGAEYRFGPVEASMPGLLAALEQCLAAPDDFHAEHRDRYREIRERVYGVRADGLAAQRCVERLLAKVETPTMSRSPSKRTRSRRLG